MDNLNSNNPLMDPFLAAEKLVRTTSGHELTRHRHIYIKAIPDPESDSSQPTSDESDEDDTFKPPETTEAEAYIMDYMNIQKLVKLLQKSSISGSIVTLSCLLDYDLSVPLNIKAIRNCGGLEYLLNIVTGAGDQIRARNMALQAIVNLIENNVPTRRHVVNLGGVEVLVEQLDNPGFDLQVWACEGLFHLAKGRKARRGIRLAGGINRLIDRLRQPLSILNKPKNLCTDPEMVVNNIYKKAAWTLRALAVGFKNRRTMMADGIVEEMEKVLNINNNYNAILPMMSCIMEFCGDKDFHIVLEKNKIIYLLIRHLAHSNYDMKYICANAIFKCGEISYLRPILYQEDAIFYLADILRATDLNENLNLMIATTGAIWKCAMHPESTKRLFQLGATELLIELLTDPRKKLVTNVMGAIYEMSKNPKVKDMLKNMGAIPVMIKRLYTLYDPLLANTVDALGECAKDKSLMQIIESADGFRLVFSQIKNPNKKVHRRAALALVPFILNGEDSGETVRNIDLGIPKVIELLEISDDPYVLGAVCSCIATMALDIENLACMSDSAIVNKLYNHLDTKNSYLRTHLCTAIGNCCGWGRNARLFGCLGAIPKIVNYMTDLCKDVHRTAVYAMARLSREPSNCVRLHRVSATQFLLISMSSTDDELKISAAECMRNIRRLALRVERAIFGRDTI